MADLDRSGGHELIRKMPKLQKQHLEIILSEKRNQIKKLQVALDHLKTVDIKKIEHQIDLTTEEIRHIEKELKNVIIDGEVK